MNFDILVDDVLVSMSYVDETRTLNLGALTLRDLCSDAGLQPDDTGDDALAHTVMEKLYGKDVFSGKSLQRIHLEGYDEDIIRKLYLQWMYEGTEHGVEAGMNFAQMFDAWVKAKGPRHAPSFMQDFGTWRGISDETADHELDLLFGSDDEPGDTEHGASNDNPLEETSDVSQDASGDASDGSVPDEADAKEASTDGDDTDQTPIPDVSDETDSTDGSITSDTSEDGVAGNDASDEDAGEVPADGAFDGDADETPADDVSDGDDSDGEADEASGNTDGGTQSMASGLESAASAPSESDDDELIAQAAGLDAGIVNMPLDEPDDDDESAAPANDSDAKSDDRQSVTSGRDSNDHGFINGLLHKQGIPNHNAYENGPSPDVTR